jgi:hypothetical protein
VTAPKIAPVLRAKIIKKVIKDIIENDAISKINNSNDNTNNSDIDNYKKYIILDEGVESAHCLTFADLDAIKKKIESLSILMNIKDEETHYKISFPIIEIDDENNPEKLINKWMIDNNLKEYTSDLTTRLINITGREHDILIYVAFIK